MYGTSCWSSVHEGPFCIWRHRSFMDVAVCYAWCCQSCLKSFCNKNISGKNKYLFIVLILYCCYHCYLLRFKYLVVYYGLLLELPEHHLLILYTILCHPSMCQWLKSSLPGIKAWKFNTIKYVTISRKDTIPFPSAFHLLILFALHLY
jgi:hypothetical protein